MYIDIIIILLIILGGVFYYKKFSSLVYLYVLVDLLLRILNFISNNTKIIELKILLKRYFPKSINYVLSKYTGGIVYDLLIWIGLVFYVVFYFYTIRDFVRKKK